MSGIDKKISDLLGLGEFILILWLITRIIKPIVGVIALVLLFMWCYHNRNVPQPELCGVAHNNGVYVPPPSLHPENDIAPAQHDSRR